jgi:hypothetical protein
MLNDTRGRLDNAIDRAVRGMMHVDPAPGLRGRVADRLEKPRPRGTLKYSFAAAAAVIVVGLGSIALFRAFQPNAAVHPGVSDAASSRTVSADPQPRATQAPSSMPAPAAASTTRGTAVERPRVLPRPSVIFNGARDRVSAANVRPQAITSGTEAAAGVTMMPMPDGLAPISPIVIAPISLAPIAIPPLAVTPLTVRK